MSEIIRKGAEKVIWIQKSWSWLHMHFWFALLSNGIVRLEEFREEQQEWPKANACLWKNNWAGQDSMAWEGDYLGEEVTHIYKTVSTM